MSTRRANPNAPLSQERYMSSPEFAELRAISGTAVAKPDEHVKELLDLYSRCLKAVEGKGHEKEAAR